MIDDKSIPICITFICATESTRLVSVLALVSICSGLIDKSGVNIIASIRVGVLPVCLQQAYSNDNSEITSMCLSVSIFMSFTVFNCTSCIAFFLLLLLCLSVCVYVSCFICLWAMLPGLNKKDDDDDEYTVDCSRLCDVLTTCRLHSSTYYDM